MEEKRNMFPETMNQPECYEEQKECNLISRVIKALLRIVPDLRKVV